MVDHHDFRVWHFRPGEELRFLKSLYSPITNRHSPSSQNHHHIRRNPLSYCYLPKYLSPFLISYPSCPHHHLHSHQDRPLFQIGGQDY